MVSLLALPVMSYAYNIHLDVVSSTGASTATFNKDLDTSITVKVLLNSDTALNGWNYNVTANQGAGDTAWGMTGSPKVEGNYAGNLAGEVYTSANTPGTLSAINYIGGENYFWITGSCAAVVDGLVATLTIVPLGPLTVGQHVTFGVDANADGGLYGNGNAFNLSTGDIPMTGNLLDVTITPEPASALLLLLAVPFIRRRTA